MAQVFAIPQGIWYYFGITIFACNDSFRGYHIAFPKIIAKYSIPSCQRSLSKFCIPQWEIITEGFEYLIHELTISAQNTSVNPPCRDLQCSWSTRIKISHDIASDRECYSSQNNWNNSTQKPPKPVEMITEVENLDVYRISNVQWQKENSNRCVPKNNCNNDNGYNLFY